MSRRSGTGDLPTTARRAADRRCRVTRLSARDPGGRGVLSHAFSPFLGGVLDAGCLDAEAGFDAGEVFAGEVFAGVWEPTPSFAGEAFFGAGASTSLRLVTPTYFFPGSGCSGVKPYFLTIFCSRLLPLCFQHS